MLDTVKNITQEFFEKMSVDFSNLEVIEEQENIFLVKIKTEESGLLIWPHGKNLDAIQSILKNILSKQLDSNIRLHMEINDYQASKDQRLFSFVQSKINYVKKTGQDFKLPYYGWYERKKIHSYVAELNDPTIFTKSIGEWNQRRLYLCKKEAKLTIDIDGDDI